MIVLLPSALQTLRPGLGVRGCEQRRVDQHRVARADLRHGHHVLAALLRPAL